MVCHVDGEDLRTFFVRQSEQILYLVELVGILALVQQNFTIRVVDDCALDDIRGDDVLDLLRDDDGLAKEFSDRLKEVFQVFRHALLADCFPRFFQKYHLADTFQTAHLVDEGFHDDDGHDRE